MQRRLPGAFILWGVIWGVWLGGSGEVVAAPKNKKPLSLQSQLSNLDRQIQRKRYHGLLYRLKTLEKALPGAPLSPSRKVSLLAALACVGSYAQQLAWQRSLRYGPSPVRKWKYLRYHLGWHKSWLKKTKKLRRAHQRCLLALQHGGAQVSFLRPYVEPVLLRHFLRRLSLRKKLIKKRLRVLEGVQESAKKSPPGEVVQQAILDRINEEGKEMAQEARKGLWHKILIWRRIRAIMKHVPHLPPRPHVWRAKLPLFLHAPLAVPLGVIGGIVTLIGELGNQRITRAIGWGGVGASASVVLAIPAAMAWYKPDWILVGTPVSVLVTAASVMMIAMNHRVVTPLGWGMLGALPLHLLWNIGGWVNYSRQRAQQRIWNNYLQPAPASL